MTKKEELEMLQSTGKTNENHGPLPIIKIEKSENENATVLKKQETVISGWWMALGTAMYLLANYLKIKSIIYQTELIYFIGMVLLLVYLGLNFFDRRTNPGLDAKALKKQSLIIFNLSKLIIIVAFVILGFLLGDCVKNLIWRHK